VSAPRFTFIEESDAVVDPQPAVPSVPAPMFTEIEATDVLAFRRRVLFLNGKEAAEMVGFAAWWEA
jgi:hypothetical protein